MRELDGLMRGLVEWFRGHGWCCECGEVVDVLCLLVRCARVYFENGCGLSVFWVVWELCSGWRFWMGLKLGVCIMVGSEKLGSDDGWS